MRENRGGGSAPERVAVGRGRAVVIVVVAAALAACWDPPKDLGPGDPLANGLMTPDELAVLAKMQELLAKVDELVATPGLAAGHRRAIEAAVRDVQRAADVIRDYRHDDMSRGAVIASTSTTAGAIVADDVTGVGVANDVLLVPCAIAAVAGLIAFPPASAGDYAKAWGALRQELSDLRKVVDAAAAAVAAASGAATAACPESVQAADDPDAPPGGAPETAPAPAPGRAPRPGLRPRPVRPGEDDERPEQCRPRPVCPHLGGDLIHNTCADEVPPNLYPGCDVVVYDKHFDALDPTGALWEVKTDDWSNYNEFMQKRTYRAHSETALVEHAFATACGFPFVFAVSDEQLFRKLDEDSALEIVSFRYVPECRRQVKR